MYPEIKFSRALLTILVQRCPMSRLCWRSKAVGSLPGQSSFALKYCGEMERSKAIS